MPSEKKQRSVYFKKNLYSALTIVVAIVVMLIMKENSINTLQGGTSIEMAKEIAEEFVIIKQTEAELLNHSKVIDEANGVYQIPIERAMELVVQDYKK